MTSSISYLPHRQTSHWLEPFLSLSHDAFLVFNQSMEILFANPACVDFFGRRPTVLVGSKVESLGAIGALIADDLKNVFLKNIQQENSHSLRDGTDRHFEIHYSAPHILDQRSDKGVLAIVRDTTPTQKIIQELKDARTHMQTQAKALQYFDLVSESDLMGNITYANRDFCKTAGYEKNQVTTLNYRDFNSGHHPKDFFQKLWKTIAQGKVWNGIIKNKRADQSYFFVDTIITPILDSAGNINKFLTLQRDISESQQKFEEAQTFLFQFRDAFLHTPISMLSLDLTGNILFCNNHFLNMTKFNQEEVRSKKWIKHFIHREAQNDIQNIFLKILSKQSRTRKFEAHLINHNGQQKLFSWKASPTLDENKKVTGISLIGEDITNRIYNEQELKSLRQNLEAGRKKTFGYLTHQLKSGFVSLRSGLSLIDDEIKTQPSPALALLVEKMGKKLETLENINTKFLESLESDARSSMMAPEKTDFKIIIQDLLQDAKQQTKKNVEFTTESLELLSSVWWDPMLMREVFDNLVSNSIKYSADQGVQITISCTQVKRDVLIAFQDNGLGILSKDIHHVFDIFSRGTSTKEGFGVGLKFCQDVVQRHQGAIWVESEFGKGTSFFMRLPIQPNRR